MPRVGLVRAHAPLRAELEVIVDGVAKRLGDLRHGIPLEGDHIAEADHVPVEDAHALVELDDSRVTLVLHTGLNPAAGSRQRGGSLAGPGPSTSRPPCADGVYGRWRRRHSGPLSRASLCPRTDQPPGPGAAIRCHARRYWRGRGPRRFRAGYPAVSLSLRKSSGGSARDRLSGPGAHHKAA